MDRRKFLTGAAGATVLGTVLGTQPAAADTPKQPASFGAPGANFPKVGGDLGNQNHTPLNQINRRTLDRLGGAWHVNLEGGDTSSAPAEHDRGAGRRPVRPDHPAERVRRRRPDRRGQVEDERRHRDAPTCAASRSAEGKVFSTSGANIVYALDQKTGAVVWKTQLLTEDPARATPEPCDPANGQCGGTTGTLAGAVVYWDGLIYVGMQGSTAGARGRAYALDAATGEIAWTFWAVPGPGQFGDDTWEGDSWKTGGAVCWIHPAIDPELGPVYWTFGNPYPRTDGSTRGGDNLFANSLVALDAKTGKRRWHFQSVHHDIWDYDNVMSPVLIDLRIDGRLRKVLVYGSKVGMYYILDRTDGKPVQGIEERPVPQDAAAQDLADPAVPRRATRSSRRSRGWTTRPARCPSTRPAACSRRTGTARRSSSPAPAAAPTGRTSRSTPAPAGSTSATA